MSRVIPLVPADPSRIGRYPLTGRLAGPLAEGSGAGSARRDGPAPFVVYLGRTNAGEAVTITLLQPVGADDTAARDRFIAEADAARLVAPLCVARMLDAGFHADFPYLVSEHVPGRSLAETVVADGPLAEDMLHAVAIGAATGLAAIHQAGLVHGHFGADRLVLGPDGPKVVHSGVTPPVGLATPAADVHAWAIAVLFAATGSARPGLQDLGLLPTPVRQLVAVCLDRDPGTRPAAKVIVTRLLGQVEPQTGVLAAGSRAASPARRLASPVAAGPRPPLADDAGMVQAPARWTLSRRAARVGVAVAVVAATAAITAVITLPNRGAVEQNAAGHRTATAVPSRVRQAGTSPSATLSPASPPVTPSTRAQRIPDALSGSWSGQVRQAEPALTVATQIQFTKGASNGSISYPTFGCSGVLTLTSENGSQLVFSQGIVQGQGTCGQGTVTLTLHGTSIDFVFNPATPGGPELRGTLAQQ